MHVLVFPRSNTTSAYEVHTFKNKNKIIKRHFCVSFTLLHLFIRNCKFVMIKAPTYDIAHDENSMSSLARLESKV